MAWIKKKVLVAKGKSFFKRFAFLHMFNQTFSPCDQSFFLQRKSFFSKRKNLQEKALVAKELQKSSVKIYLK
jgi:hypothetical protein